MTFDPITGNEVQIGTAYQAFHAGDDTSENIERFISKIKKVYEGETAHKIVRIQSQKGSSSFFTNAGHEEQMYNDIEDFLQEQVDKGFFPLTFNAILFVSYSPLRVVKNDNEEE